MSYRQTHAAVLGDVEELLAYDRLPAACGATGRAPATIKPTIGDHSERRLALALPAKAQAAPKRTAVPQEDFEGVAALEQRGDGHVHLLQVCGHELHARAAA